MLKRLLRGATRALLRVVPLPDPWTRVETRIRRDRFGATAPEDWRALLVAPSDVPVAERADLDAFLLTCRTTYATGPDTAPPWPLPRQFETLRSGDCTAHATWGWRKLLDLGYDAELIVGRTTPFDPNDDRHAWVIFRDRSGEEVLFETVAKAPARLYRPLSSVRDRYRPEYGVNARGERFGFAGGLYSARDGAI